MTKPIDILRRELHAFCELAQRRGWTIGTDGSGMAISYGDNVTPGVCCPMGAVEVCTWKSMAWESLFADQAAVSSFAAGFDGDRRWGFMNGELFELGREFRRHYCSEAPQ